MRLSIEIIAAPEGADVTRGPIELGHAGGEIGRSADSDLRLPDPERYVSSQHAIISRREHGYFLQDVSKNGTRLNGIKLCSTDDPVQLRHGDVIKIGEYKLIVRMDSVVQLDPDTAPEASADDEVFYASVKPEPRRAPDTPSGASLNNEAIGDDWLSMSDEYSFDRLMGVERGETSRNAARSAQHQVGSGAPAEGGMPPPAPVAAPKPQPQIPVTAVDHVELRAFERFIRSAGLKDYQLSKDAGPEMLDHLGEVFREIISGVMQMLQARADMKSEFHMSVTTIKKNENNPLKFAVDVDEAMRYLLSGKQGAYLSAKDSLHEGFNDILDHQTALKAGVQAAFDAMLEAFDPSLLEQKFDKYNKGGLVSSLGKKGRNWELYEDYYRDLATAEDSFDSLPGRRFAKAYESRIAHLAKARKGR